jgi:DNA-binding transcriptional regulator YhcF (GntR family)
MDIVLNRKAGVPVRDQIRTQLELKILGGELAAGQRLPSVRSLARRLRVHANTISAAYQELEVAGQLELRPGSGVFVKPSGRKQIEEAEGLDEMIRIALQKAFDRGYSGEQVRGAVHRWLAAAPPDRVVVVDRSREMAELLAHEIQRSLRVPATARTLEEASREPAALSGALAVVLPYNLQAVSALRPGAAVEAVNLEVAIAVRDAILALPEGTIALVVSHAAAVLPFASVLFRSLRGDDLLVETRLLAATEEWQRLVLAADVVFVDALAAPVVRKARPRRLLEVHFLPESVHERLRDALSVVVPRT